VIETLTLKASNTDLIGEPATDLINNVWQAFEYTANPLKPWFRTIGRAKRAKAIIAKI
jgi:hypothetical protein